MSNSQEGRKNSHICIVPFLVSLILILLTRIVHFYQGIQYKWTHHIMSKAIVYYRAHFGVAVSMGLNKCIMAYVCHFNIIQNALMPKNPLYSVLSSSHFSNHWPFYSLLWFSGVSVHFLCIRFFHQLIRLGIPHVFS